MTYHKPKGFDKPLHFITDNDRKKLARKLDNIDLNSKIPILKITEPKEKLS